MLLPNDINPLNTAYFNGALALKLLETSGKKEMDFLDLYGRVKSSHQLSFQSFILSLDWLFLLGAIKLSKEGRISKCF